MIKVNRPASGPNQLRESGEAQTLSDCAAYDAAPSDYIAGAPFPKRKYYTAKDVKNALAAYHFSKCCYCETRYPDLDNLDVEHFRPKAGVRQDLDQTADEYPGYYWLAYSWSNLLLSCNPCNRRYKKTFFSLLDPSKRAHSHHDDVHQEHSLLIDPANEDPRDHIRFADDSPIATSDRGRLTMQLLQLRRPPLGEERRSHLAQVRRIYDAIRLYPMLDPSPDAAALHKDLRHWLALAARPEAKFSSMVSDFLAIHPL